MLYIPIRYINNGEPLDQVTLNRNGYDTQENLEEIISRLTTVEGATGGEVTEIPDTLVLRDTYGTAQFVAPRVATNPLRLADLVNNLTTDQASRALTAAMGVHIKSLIDNLESKVETAVPPGAVLGFAMNSAPSGWIVCDGRAVSRTTYSALYAEIGTLYGAGNGSSTFNVPDYRGVFLRGIDRNRNLDPGRGFGVYQDDMIQRHKHVMAYSERYSGYFGRTNSRGYAGSGDTDTDNYLYHTNDGSDYNGTVNSAGVIGSETRPKNVSVLHCIKS